VGGQEVENVVGSVDVAHLFMAVEALAKDVGVLEAHLVEERD
jgi:hypothetical protein